VLTHCDYWSGNVVWRDGRLTGIVDWSGGARGPRGYDLGWCRLDLVLLFDERIADVFLAAYEAAIGQSLGDVGLWDGWAVARSHDVVETWAPNYAALAVVPEDVVHPGLLGGWLVSKPPAPRRTPDEVAR
jgi:aminoglycoside phosphotransferase (APT) family kinase protein